MSSPLLVQLGKFGDCINILPFAYMMSKQLGEVEWLIGEKWASLLDGCSYVRSKVFDGSDDDLPRAIAENRGRPLWITQAWMNPNPQRVTNSFAKEQWAFVGCLEQRGKWPLIFDQRDKKRETDLLSRWVHPGVRPLILFSGRSVSTPYRYSERLLKLLRYEFGEMHVLDISSNNAERIYDMIALYDAADLLVSVDTSHLHLVRASYAPVVALINDGWMGCTPPPQTVAAWRYAELGDNLSPVIEAARNQLSRKIKSVAVVIQTYPPRHDDRHKRAMATHRVNEPDVLLNSVNDNPPATKHLLKEGLDQGKDAVVFTHDDVTFLPDTIGRIKAHLQKFDFGCSRRPSNPVHCGREIFWFKSDWLKKNWANIPDPYWSVQKPDLIMVRYLRKLCGIPTTLENLNYDFPPVDVPAGIITHEEHVSHWANAEIENSREGLHNEELWRAG